MHQMPFDALKFLKMFILCINKVLNLIQMADDQNKAPDAKLTAKPRCR